MTLYDIPLFSNPLLGKSYSKVDSGHYARIKRALSGHFLESERINDYLSPKLVPSPKSKNPNPKNPNSNCKQIIQSSKDGLVWEESSDTQSETS